MTAASSDDGAVGARDDAAASELRPLSRRELLRRGAVGGAVAVGGGLLAREWLADPSVVDGEGHLARQTTLTTPAAAEPVAAGGHGGYGHVPPAHLSADALDAVTIPPAFDGRQAVTREFHLPVTEHRMTVADGVEVDAWSYDGTVPGPIVRATEGDTLRLHLDNRTRRPHNLHLHGRHDPAMDGWEPVPPGTGFTYQVVAGPVGLHPYHCHLPPLAEHIVHGLYGAMIVDPVGGRPSAHEFVLTLAGWDLDADGRLDLACWNGVAGFFRRFPIRVPVGERVRLYLQNMLEYEPVGSFHLHAQTFDVYRSGTSQEPDEHTDTITLGQGERAIVEFELPEPGRYMFHPHQHRLADIGAMGWFAAV